MTLLSSWIDGLFAVIVTALWVTQQITLALIKSNTFSYKTPFYTKSYTILTFITFTVGISYSVVALITGYSQDFYAQATLTTIAGFIVAVAVENPQWRRIIRNSKKLEGLLCRQKYKIGDNRFLDITNTSTCVLKVLRKRKSYLSNDTRVINRETGRYANFGGEVHTFNGKGYVIIHLNESYFLGTDISTLNSLFSGYDSFGESRQWCMLEVAWFPSQMLSFDTNKANLCTLLIMIAISNEGCYKSLLNWKSVAAKVPSWIVKKVVTIRSMYTITYNSNAELSVINNQNINNIVKCIQNTANYEYNIDIAISLMMILKSEHNTIVSNVITKVGTYFEKCFNNTRQLDEIMFSWKTIVSSFFTA